MPSEVADQQNEDRNESLIPSPLLNPNNITCSAEDFKEAEKLAKEGVVGIEKAESAEDITVKTRAGIARRILKLATHYQIDLQSENASRQILKKMKEGNTFTPLYGLASRIEGILEDARVSRGGDRYRKLFETSNDAIMLLDDKGFFDCNEATLKTFGYASKTEFCSKHPSEVSPPNQPNGENSFDMAQGKIMEAHRKGKNFFEWMHKRADGEDFHANVLLTPIEVGGKEVLQATVRDISEQKKYQEELQRSRAELSVALNHIPVPTVFIDSDGRITKAFQAAKELNRNPENSDVIGSRVGDMLECVNAIGNPEGCGNSEECADCEGRKAVQEVIDSGKPISKKLVTFRTKGDKYDRSFLLSATPLPIDGEKKQTIISMEEITEHLRIKEQYYQAQKMEAIARLAGGIAHDMNNILGVVLGISDVMNIELAELIDKFNNLLRRIENLVKLAPHSPQGSELMREAKDFGENLPQLLEDSAQIKTAGKRGKELMQQILAFSRPKKDSEKEPMDVNSVINEVYNLLGRTAGENIKFDVSLGVGINKINADEGQIHQVIMNLVVNAIDAMEGKGILGILSSKVTPSDRLPKEVAENPENYVQLVIEDTGMGIKESDIENIFEPFFTTKEVGRGTGLGLSVVHGIIKNHNGFIRVQSEEGMGTQFYIYLPIYREDEEIEKTPEADEWPMGNGERILVVDDNEDIVKMMPRVLGRKGYEVTVASSSKEAIELFEAKKGEFDMLLTDVGMADMNGFNLAKKLQKEKESLKVMIMSGYLKENLDSIEGRRDFELLAKPFEIGDVLRKMKKIFEGGK